tara:strand:+ start:1888 stop:2697 length:810 start_codon:yes stop_codon:yes gene_type:complete
MNTTVDDFFEIIKNYFNTLITFFIALNIISILVIFFAIPDKYTSEATLAPRADNTMQQSGTLSTLASLTGFSLPDTQNNIPKHVIALEIIESKSFFSDLLTESFIIELYGNGFKKEFNFEDAHSKFLKSLSIAKDRDTGIIKISITHTSASVAQNWLEAIISSSNNIIRDRHLKESEASINFLKETSSKEDDLNIKKVLNEILYKELSNFILINKMEEYAFEIIDRPNLSTKKSFPNRTNLTILGFFLSSIFSLLILSIYLNVKPSNKI